MVSLTNISLELHTKMAEEIDLELCSYGQLSEVQMLRDLNLDLGSGQGHVNIHSTCSTVYVEHAGTQYLHAQPRDCSVTHYQNMAI